MLKSIMTRMDVRHLILFLAISSVLITLANAFHAAFRVERDFLVEHTLEDNRTHAAKLAAGTEQFFTTTREVLAYSARQISEATGASDRLVDEAVLMREIERLHQQTKRFNSVFVADASGRVLSIAPANVPLRGQVLTSSGALEALRERRPLVSQPYLSQAGNLILAFSHPLVNTAGQYLGYIGGTLYLKERNMLYHLLAESFHADGTYMYVVDQNRQLIYHPDPARVGEIVGQNPVIDAVLAGSSGARRVTNSQGTDVLAGYAPLASAGWGVVVQRPTDLTLAPLGQLMLDVLRHILPTAVLTLLLIWWAARQISRPLRQLAQGVRDMDAPRTAADIEQVRAWYFEAEQLKQAMLRGVSLASQQIGALNLAAQTDPLTGLVNRRGLNLTLEAWQLEGRSFAVVALDIDHFKRVNDTFGHDVGDLVLKQLAEEMRSVSREGDLVCRSGGEEFLVLLAEFTSSTAMQFAERLRRQVEQALFPQVGHITISLGVARFPDQGDSISAVLKAADEALYTAKQTGRNRSVMAVTGSAAKP